MDQPQSFGDFDHGYSRLQPAVHQVNLPFSYYRSKKGTSLLPPTGDEDSTHHKRDEIRSIASRQTQWKKHKLCLSIHLHNVYPKGRRAYSLLQTTMEPLSHGLWSCSSKPLTDRTGHYRAEGRFSSTGTTGVHPGYRNTPTTTGQGLIVRR